MAYDWNRILSLGLAALAFGAALLTGEARFIVLSVMMLAWPMAIVWHADDLASTRGLHFGLVDRDSPAWIVRILGWIALVVVSVAVVAAGLSILLADD